MFMFDKITFPHMLHIGPPPFLLIRLLIPLTLAAQSVD